MAGQNDFTLSFGSNVDDFRKLILADLTLVKDDIKATGTEMVRLVSLAAKVKTEVNKELADVKTTPPSGGGGGGGLLSSAELKHMADDYHSMQAELQGLMGKIKLVVDALQPITGQVRKERGNTRRSTAQQTRINKGLVWQDPATGNTVAAGTPGAVQMRPSRPARPAPAPAPARISDTGNGKGTPVNIQGTPKVLIKEAQFKRLVDALAENTKATKDNTDALKKGGTGGGGGGKGGAKTSADTAVSREESSAGQIKAQIARRQRLAALKAERERAAGGGAFDPELFNTAAANTKKLRERGEASGYAGDEYIKHLDKAITSLTTQLKGVPRVKELRNQLAEAGGGKKGGTRKGSESLERTAEEVDAQAARIEAKLKEVSERTGVSIEDLREAAVDTGKMTRAEKRIANKAKAALDKREHQRGDTSLSLQERKNVTGLLTRAGGTHAELTKMPQEDLRAMLKAFENEGYAGAFRSDQKKAGGKAVTNDRLAAELVRLHADLVKTGQTFHDLNTGKWKGKEETVSPAIRKDLRDLMEVRKLSDKDREAYDVRAANSRSGGNLKDAIDPKMSTRSKVEKGRPQYGGDFQIGDDFKQVIAALAHIKDRNEQAIPKVALDSALRLMSRGRNIYDPKYDQGAQSKDSKAAVRDARRGTDAIDRVVGDFVKLQKQIADTKASMQRMTAEQDHLSRQATLEPEQRARIDHLNNVLRPEAKARLDDLRGKAEGMLGKPNDPNDPSKGRANDFIQALATNTKYLKGLAERDVLRNAMQGGRRGDRSQLQWEVQQTAEANERHAARMAIPQAVTETWFGRRTRQGARSGKQPGSGGDSFENFTSGFPGVIGDAQRGLRYSSEASGIGDPRLLKQLDKALRRKIKAEEALAAEREKEVPNVLAEMKAEDELRKSLKRAISVYDRMGLQDKAGLPARRIEQDPLTGRESYRQDVGRGKEGPHDAANRAALDRAVERYKTERGDKAASDPSLKSLRLEIMRLNKALKGSSLAPGRTAADQSKGIGQFIGTPIEKAVKEAFAHQASLPAPPAPDLAHIPNRVVDPLAPHGPYAEQFPDTHGLAKLLGLDPKTFKVEGREVGVGKEARFLPGGVQGAAQDRIDQIRKDQALAKNDEGLGKRLAAEKRLIDNAVARAAKSAVPGSKVTPDDIVAALKKTVAGRAYATGKSDEGLRQRVTTVQAGVPQRQLKEALARGKDASLGEAADKAEAIIAQIEAERVATVAKRKGAAATEEQTANTEVKTAAKNKGTAKKKADAATVSAEALAPVVKETEAAQKYQPVTTPVTDEQKKRDEQNARRRQRYAEKKGRVFEVAPDGTAEATATTESTAASKRSTAAKESDRAADTEVQTAAQKTRTAAKGKKAAAAPPAPPAPPKPPTGGTPPEPPEETPEQKAAREARNARARELRAAKKEGREPAPLPPRPVAAPRPGPARTREQISAAAEAARIEREAAKATRDAAEAERLLAVAAAARAKETAKAAAAAERQGNADARMAATAATADRVTKSLSADVRKEAEALKGLTGAERDNAAIIERQITLYARMSNEMRGAGATANQVRNAFQQVSANAGARVGGKDFTNISQQAKARGLIAGPNAKHEAEQEGNSLKDAFAGALFGNSGFWARIANSTGTFIIRNFSAGIVFGLTAALSDVVKQAIETESTFVRVSQALDSTGRDVGSLRTGLQSISTTYGVALEDVYNTAAGLVGVFQNVGDIKVATEVSAQLQMISNGALNATEAMGVLSSIMSAFSFKDEAGDALSGADALTHVADVLTTIQNRLGVNIEVTAEGVGRLAGLAEMVSLSFEETAVYVAEIAKKTNQTGAAAGEQFSRIIATMQTGRGQKALEEAFPDISGALRDADYGSVLKQLMEGFDSLGEAQQDRLAGVLGGARQAAATAALLKDGAQALDTVRAAEDSNGEAQKRATEIAKQLNVEIKKLQANFVNLGSNLIRTGILDFFGGMFLVVNKTLGAVNTLLSKFNDFAEATPFFSWIVKATSALLGLILAMKVLRAAKAGFGAFLKQDTAGGAAARAFTGRQLNEDGTRKLTTADRIRQGAVDRVGRVATYTRGGEPGVIRPSVAGRVNTALFSKPLDLLSRGAERAASSMRVLSDATFAAGQTRRTGFWDRNAGRADRLGGFLDRRATGIADRFSGETAANGARSPGLWTRGAERIGAAGERMRDRQSAFRAQAQQALARQNLGGAASARLGQLGAGAAAKGLGALSKTMNTLASSSMVANTAMAAFTIVFTLAIMEMIRASESAKQTQKNFEASFTEKGRETEEEKEERYIGPNTDKVLDNQKSMQGAGGVFRAVGAGAIDMFNFKRGGPQAMAQRTFQEALGVFGIGDGGGQGSLSSRLSGDVDAEMWNDASKPIMDGFKAFQKMAKNGSESRAAVEAEGRKISDEIDAKAAEINENDDLSTEQKDALLSQLEKDRMAAEKVVANLLNSISGLHKADQWVGTQIDEVLGVLSVFASTPQAGANHASAVRALLDSANIDLGGGGDSALTDDWKALMEGRGATSELLEHQLAITDVALKNAENVYRAKVSANDTPEEISKAQDRMKGLIAQYESTSRAIIDSIANAGNEMATGLRGTGDYAGAEAALKNAAQQIRDKVQASRDKSAAIEFNKNLHNKYSNIPASAGRYEDPNVDVFGDDEIDALLNRANQISGQGTEVGQIGLAKANRQSIRETRNSEEIARLQYEIAINKLNALKAAAANGDTGITDEMIEAAEEEAVTTGRAKVDAAQSKKQAGFQARSAGLLNTVSKAQNDESAAWQAVQYAKEQYTVDSEQYLNALAAARNASQGTIQAVLDEANAQRELELAMMAPADTVGRARKALSNAQAAQRDAARFGTSSTQYKQATQAVIEAQRQIDQAIFEIADANSNLAITLAQAAGKTVDVAKLKLEAAQEALARARQQSGGAVTAATINAEAGVAQAQADVRDATLQDRLDTIDFQKNMDQITSQGAISMLTELLNMKDLTEQQRRDILLRIKGLQDELSSSLQGAFNLPDTIKPPTVYEVRRALGIDEYLKNMKDATDVSGITGNGASSSSANQILREIQAGMTANGRAVPSQSQDYSNSNNNVTINGASFDDVISWLQQYLGSGAQVVRTVTPRRY